MSWNLLIHRAHPKDKSLIALGKTDAVKATLQTAFPELDWESDSEAVLAVEGGFQLELTIEEEEVKDIYTRGGANHLRELADLCLKNGWRLADAQEGEEINLDDPVQWFEERNG